MCCVCVCLREFVHVNWFPSVSLGSDHWHHRLEIMYSVCIYYFMLCDPCVNCLYSVYFTPKIYFVVNISLDFLFLHAMCICDLLSVYFVLFVGFFSLSLHFYFYFVFCMLVSIYIHTFAVLQRNDSFCAHKIPNLEYLQEKKTRNSSSNSNSQ